jgi:hypothetical protein
MPERRFNRHAFKRQENSSFAGHMDFRKLIRSGSRDADLSLPLSEVEMGRVSRLCYDLIRFRATAEEARELVATARNKPSQKIMQDTVFEDLTLPLDEFKRRRDKGGLLKGDAFAILDPAIRFERQLPKIDGLLLQLSKTTAKYGPSTPLHDRLMESWGRLLQRRIEFGGLPTEVKRGRMANHVGVSINTISSTIEAFHQEFLESHRNVTLLQECRELAGRTGPRL